MNLYYLIRDEFDKLSELGREIERMLETLNQEVKLLIGVSEKMPAEKE